MKDFSGQSCVVSRRRDSTIRAWFGLWITGILLSRQAHVAAQPAVHDPQSPVFEVASIKPKNSGEQRPRWMGMQGSEFVILNVTPKELIFNNYPPTSAAYYMPNEVLGAPTWINEERFDITGKVEGTQESSRRAMGLNLLLDRFRLQAHKEMREMPIYEFVMARLDRKLGPNMKVVEDADCPKESPCHGFLSRPGPGREKGLKVTIDQISGVLASRMQRRVVDKTNLTGLFDVTLENLEIPAGIDGSTQNDPERISIFTAIQEQLGLKVRAGKAMMEVLVIDHIERPSEN